MNNMQRHRDGRTAFTLVELLVVIVIISVLVALTAAAVLGVFSQGTQTVTKNEIMQMDMAARAVMTEYGVKYLPSKIVLRRDNNYNPSDPIWGVEHQRTVKFLQQIFPKIDLRVFGSATDALGINWNNDPTPIALNTLGDDGKGNYVLHADQSLIFFLGGIPSRGSSNSCLGFSTNPRNPADITALKGPTFSTFDTSRLVAAPNGFFQYLDPWKNKMPYLYFSAYGSNNGYSSHVLLTPNRVSDATPDANSPGFSGFNVLPYFESYTPPIRFTNPDSFQILSAGKDGVFWVGGAWTPSIGAKNSQGQPVDDQANFGGPALGSKN